MGIQPLESFSQRQMHLAMLRRAKEQQSLHIANSMRIYAETSNNAFGVLSNIYGINSRREPSGKWEELGIESMEDRADRAAKAVQQGRPEPMVGKDRKVLRWRWP